MMNQQVKQPWLGIILLIGCTLMSTILHVHAQTGPTLSVQPVVSDLVLNGDNSTVVDLYLTDAVDINAFDIVVTYDATIATVSSYAFGGFLTNLWCPSQENSPGRFRLSCTQTSGTPPVNGDGSLFNLTFSGLLAGVSALSIEKEQLVDSDYALIIPEVENGTLRAYDEIPLSGMVMLQGQTAGDGATVTLDIGTIFQMGPYSTVSQDLIGANVDFGTVVGDTYGITAAFPRYIALTQDSGRTVTISPDKTALSPLRLLSGNAVWSDNVINALDLSLVRADYLKTTNDLGEGESLDADVNYDGVVDLKDLALVGGNYGLSSNDAYTDWVP